MSAPFLQRVMDGKRRQMSLLGEGERESVRDAAVALREGRSARFHRELLCPSKPIAGFHPSNPKTGSLGTPGLLGTPARPTAIIAEFKRHSPSAGAIQAQADPVELARMYEAGGAAAMSVLTEPEHFKGSLDDLRLVAASVGLPLLRKDFAVDRHQVYEAALAGAEAVLVIVAGLSDAEALKLLDAAHRTKLDVLVEVHTAEELERAAALGARLIGVNNRNLKTLEVDLETSLRLAELAPADATLVAESGLRTRADIERLQAAGYRAFLIGETLMRAADPRAELAALQGFHPQSAKSGRIGGPVEPVR